MELGKVIEAIWNLPWYKDLIIATADDVIIMLNLWPDDVIVMLKIWPLWLFIIIILIIFIILKNLL